MPVKGQVKYGGQEPIRSVDRQVEHGRLAGGLNMAASNQWGRLKGRLRPSGSEGGLSDRRLTMNSQLFLLLQIHLPDIYRVGIVM